jgi:ParB family chromosome partitioning protein
MNVRGGLGKGLGALIPAGATTLVEISPSAMTPNPRQPRKHMDEEGLETLGASIRQLGLLQPVVVRRRGTSDYELVMGERRWRAAQKAGLSAIPALVIDTDDRGALERALVENIHRQDLNPIEEAAAYRQLLDEAGVTHEQLAERVGLSRPAVTNAMRLLDLPDSVQAMVISGRLSAGHARALLGLEGNPILERMAERVAAAGLSVRETEELVRRERGQEPVAGLPARGRVGKTAGQDPGLMEISELLSEELETRVHVSMGRGRGRIVIDFGSGDDLVRIWRRIAGRDQRGTGPAQA